MYKKDEVLNLFPTPLMICSYPFDYSKELEWINKQECNKDNRNTTSGMGNRQSDDTFILDSVELRRVKTFIETKLNNYMSSIYGSKAKLVITQSWLNKAGKGESHHEHKHPNSMVSGVWYPLIDEKLPPIQFKNNRQRDVEIVPDKYNNYNSITFMLPMKAGELILFPSNLPHSVPINALTKGSLGCKDRLTYLPLDKLI